MTPQQSKSRADIGNHLADAVDTATTHPSEVAAPMVVDALTDARVSLHFQGFDDDNHWLGEHQAKTDHNDYLAVTRLAQRLVERLHIETEPAPEPTVTRAHHDTVVTAMAERIAQLESQLEVAKAKAAQA
ncbi:hypothetical protein ACTWPB_07380 [Nocardia sp. IBHARD005]|uniref:hypothetical protein n=1 Tax=Nocardia sp. IBHARD005 TaxID=3457765 RepID=UPI004058DAA1